MSSQVDSITQQEEGAIVVEPQTDETVVIETSEDGSSTIIVDEAPVTEIITETHAPAPQEAGMPQLDFATFPSQIFWLVVTFIALYVLLARSILPRIHEVLENRQNKISHDIDRAEQLRNEAEEAREVYERALKESRSKAQSLIAESAALMEKSSSARHAELDVKLSKQLAEAEQNIQAAKEQALTKLVPISKDLTQQIVEKLTGHKPKEAEVSAVLDALLKEPRHG